MTATEELRRLLDERGVEWKAFSDTYTVVSKWKLVIVEDEWLLDARFFGGLTPAQLMQVIDATLGRGECGMVPSFTKPRTLDDCQEFCCSKCGEYMVLQQFGEIEDTPNYCPNCGRKVADE